MSLLPLNKNLLWKEWMQNRWLFLLGLLILNVDTITNVLNLLMYWLNPPMGFNWGDYANSMATQFDFLINYKSPETIFKYGVYAAILLGAILLGQERSFSNTLDFLATAPVSRREILVSKYSTGFLMIVFVLFVHMIYMLAFSAFLPIDYTYWDLMYYILVRGIILLAIYSVSFCVSTIGGNLFSSFLGAFGLLYAPYWVGHLISNFMFRAGGLGNDLSNYFLVIDRLTLPNLIARMDIYYEPLVIPIMVVLCVIFFLLALYLFDRNPFEKNGRMFMFGQYRQLLRFGVPFVLALAWAAQSIYQHNPVNTLVQFLLAFLVVYFLIRLFERIRRSLGFR